MEKALKETIRWLVYFALLTPLILSAKFFFPFVSPKSLYFFALSEIIFFCWIILVLISPKYRPSFNLVFLSLFFYLLVFVLSSIFGINFSYSFWSKHERMTGLLMQLHLFGFFLALSSTFKREDFEKFFAFSVFVATLAGIFALFNLENPTMRGGGTLGNESFLGTYLLFNLFFSIFLIFSATKQRKIFLFSFLILLFCLLLAGVHFKGKSFLSFLFGALYKEGARAAKISFFGALPLFVLLYFVFSKKKIFKIFGTLILVSATIFLSFAFYSIMFESQSFFRHLVEKEVGSFGGRFFVWEIAKNGFLERPIFGWGPENFEFVFLKNFNPCFGTERCGWDVWYDRAHNIVFDTLVDRGILGLVSYFLVLFFAIFTLWKNFSQKKIEFSTFATFVCLFVAYFVQNLTVFDMVSSYLMFFLTLSFVACLEKKERVLKEKRPNSLLISIIFILFFSFFLEFVIFPAISSTSVISAITLPPFSEKRIALYKRTLEISPLGRTQIRQFFAEHSISNFEKAIFSQKEVKEEFEFLEKELRKSILENKLDFRSYLQLGQLLNVFSRIDSGKIYQAEEILKKAIELWPKNQRGYWALAQNYLYQGRAQEAVFLAQKALDLEKNLEISHAVLIQVLIFSGQKDLAREKFEEAIKINPAWENNLKKYFEKT